MSEPKRMTEDYFRLLYAGAVDGGGSKTGRRELAYEADRARASEDEKDKKLREQAVIIVALAGVVGSELARQHTAHGGAGNALSCDYALCKRLVRILKRAHEASP